MYACVMCGLMYRNSTAVHSYIHVCMYVCIVCMYMYVCMYVMYTHALSAGRRRILILVHAPPQVRVTVEQADNSPQLRLRVAHKYTTCATRTYVAHVTLTTCSTSGAQAEHRQRE